MDVTQLLTDALLKITELQTQVNQALVLVPEEIKKAFEQGKAEGLAETGVEKIYTKEEADALVSAAVEPLKAEIDALKADLETLKADFETQKVALVDTAIDEILKEYDAKQVAETQEETGFKTFLESKKSAKKDEPAV